MKLLQTLGATSLQHIIFIYINKQGRLFHTKFMVNSRKFQLLWCYASCSREKPWVSGEWWQLTTIFDYQACTVCPGSLSNPNREALSLSNERGDWIFKHLIKFSFCSGGYTATWWHSCLSNVMYFSAWGMENWCFCFPEWTCHSGLWGATITGTGRIYRDCYEQSKEK